jgi:glutathione S-transferase
MTIALYELAGSGDTKLSPHCWKSVFAILHKELVFERVGIKFFEKDRLAFSGQSLLPVLRDGGTVVSDSWAIATYLERTYPDRPTLFGGDIGEGETRFINDWTNKIQIFAFRRLFIRDAYDHVDPAEQAHYRLTREARFSESQELVISGQAVNENDVAPPESGYGGAYGGTLEAIQSDRETRINNVRNLMEPIRRVVSDQPFLAGDRPGYADYSVLGPFIWAKSVSSFRLLEADDPIHAWRDRMFRLFHGFGHNTGYPV